MPHDSQRILLFWCQRSCSNSHHHHTQTVQSYLHVLGRLLFALKIAHSCVGIWTPSNTWSLGPAQVSIPNGIMISSTAFAGLTVVTDRLTDRHCYSHCSNWLHPASAAIQAKNLRACVYVAVCFSLEVVRRPKPKRSKVSGQNPVKMLSMRTDIQQTYREQKPILSPQAVKQGELKFSHHASQPLLLPDVGNQKI